MPGSGNPSGPAVPPVGTTQAYQISCNSTLAYNSCACQCRTSFPLAPLPSNLGWSNTSVQWKSSAPTVMRFPSGSSQVHRYQPSRTSRSRIGHLLSFVNVLCASSDKTTHRARRPSWQSRKPTNNKLHCVHEFRTLFDTSSTGSSRVTAPVTSRR